MAPLCRQTLQILRKRKKKATVNHKIRNVSSSAEDQSPNLDTLPPHSTFRGSRVDEGSVRYPTPLTHRLVAVKALQEEAFLVLHSRPVVPALSLIILNSRSLASTIGIAVFNWD